MALEEYRAKRDFRKTAEPPPKPAKGHKKPIFVVQEHHARQLHYDFRLEADGVLKSWAVPKQPSMDPAMKRLAVHVEDHPLDYANFSGTIPEGQYGAGKVHIWDRGTYDNLMADKPQPKTVTQGIEDGHVEVELHGKKLRGRFALVRLQGRRFGDKDNWLLIKMKDEFARPGAEASNGARRPAPRENPVASAPGSKKRANPVASAPGSKKRANPVASALGSKKRAVRSPRRQRGGVEITHPNKVMFPDAGITKGEVVDFYRRIAPRLLPLLRDRPVTLERLPDGLGQGPHFWQKDIPDHYPDWLPRVELPTESGETVRYALVNDLKSLLYLVNQGTLTFHVWMSRVENLDRPDYVLFDLDPGGASFADVVAIAKEVREILRQEGHQAFVKTSGKTGLHVLVAWEGDGDYDVARRWAVEIAERVVEAVPDVATMERSKAKRHGRVYVDVMQNARGRHAVPPYVLRAVPTAAVSTPLAWRELAPDLDPSRFNLKTISRRLARQKRDPMASLTRSGARR